MNVGLGYWKVGRMWYVPGCLPIAFPTQAGSNPHFLELPSALRRTTCWDYKWSTLDGYDLGQPLAKLPKRSRPAPLSTLGGGGTSRSSNRTFTHLWSCCSGARRHLRHIFLQFLQTIDIIGRCYNLEVSSTSRLPLEVTYWRNATNLISI